MTRPISLHQTVAMETSPVELVEIARTVGCDGIDVFVHMPPFIVEGHPIPKLPLELVTQSTKRELLNNMCDLDVKVASIEWIGIHPDIDEQEYLGAMELGGELGAHGVTVWIQDADENRVIDNLSRLCEVAAQYNIVANLEFTGYAPHCNSVTRAAHFVRAVAQPNLKIMIDTLCLIRTGGTAPDLAALPASYFGCVQLCDGYGIYQSSTYFKEAQDRIMPGEGDWPLIDILNALPAHLPVDIEAPSRTAKAAGMPAVDRAQWAVTATKRLLDQSALAR